MKNGMRLAGLLVVLAGVGVWSLELSRTPEPSSNRRIPVMSHSGLRPSHVMAKATSVPIPAESLIRLPDTMLANLFAKQAWVKPPLPPPPPPPPLPPPPPTAPPLPFKYIGTWQADGEPTYYLQQGRQLIGAKPGQTLENVWRLNKAQGNGLEFDYLPLGQTRALRMGE